MNRSQPLISGADFPPTFPQAGTSALHGKEQPGRQRKRKRGSSMPLPTRWSQSHRSGVPGARVRRSESGGKLPSLLSAAANVGTAEQTSAPRKTRVAAGGADNGLHRADDDGRLAAA